MGVSNVGQEVPDRSGGLRHNGFMAERQMTIDECIAVATAGSDGHPPVCNSPEGRDVQVSDATAERVAKQFADPVVEAVEHAIGVSLSESVSVDVLSEVEDGLAELIQDAFDGHA